MSDYRAGIIGCGNMGINHARGYEFTERAKIVAGADPKAESRERFQEAFPEAKLYSKYEEMLSEEGLDLVSVTTWPSFHCEAVVAAAASGLKGIISEKPIATNLAEADEMIAACEKHGVTFAVSHQHRYDPQSIVARDLIDSGAIGNRLTIFGHCSLDLLNNGTHVVDLINFLNGDAPVEWLMGQTEIRRHLKGRGNHPDMVMEDMAIARVQYANGVVAHFELGEYADPAYHFRVAGTEGMLEVNLPGGPALKYLTSSEAGWQVPDLPALPRPHYSVIQEMLDALEEGRPHASHAGLARNDLEILIAVFQSSLTRSMVDFPHQIMGLPLTELFSEKLS